MIAPTQSHAKHKVQLIRLLIALVDDDYLSRKTYFKGGTCAALLGYLDRFSVDLDFDLDKNANIKKVDKCVRLITKKLGFEIQKKSTKSLFYILKYEAVPFERNTLKLSFMTEELQGNKYEQKYIGEIDRFVTCQTRETMFANKLIALTNRFKKNKTVAVRDVYDIHYFFEQGYVYDPKIIKLRTGKDAKQYLAEVVEFIQHHITDKNVSEDLSFLVDQNKLKQIRKTLKQETIILVQDEIKRISK